MYLPLELWVESKIQWENFNLHPFFVLFIIRFWVLKLVIAASGKVSLLGVLSFKIGKNMGNRTSILKSIEKANELISIKHNVEQMEHMIGFDHY